MNTTAAARRPLSKKASIAWYTALLLVPLLTAAILVRLYHNQAAHFASRKIDVYGTVPPFQLVNQRGKVFGSGDLTGRIWIADFIYTTCPGPCPMISARMSELQKPLEKTDVHLVSFSVDPDKDTPEVLRGYAEKLNAQPQRWDFLTGSRSAIYNLSRYGFKLAASDGSDAQGIPVHSSRMILVDRSGIIRGYYDATEPDAITKLLADTNHLLREQPR
jgi:cytochrome oxidase Cu insertion factor (SCO1/SenC/PrrC family)